MVLKQKAGGQQHRLLPTGQEQQQKKTNDWFIAIKIHS